MAQFVELKFSFLRFRYYIDFVLLILNFLGRPTYMLVGLYFTKDSSFSSFFRQPLSAFAERNSTKTGHTLVSECHLKMHVRNLGYPLPLQIGGPKTTSLGRLRNLTAICTAYIFGMKHDIHNWSSALTIIRGLIHRPKMSRTLSYKRLKT